MRFVQFAVYRIEKRSEVITTLHCTCITTGLTHLTRKSLKFYDRTLGNNVL